MEYLLELPNSLGSSTLRYRARIKNRDGTSKTLRLVPGRPVTVPPEVENTSTFWIERYSEESDREPTVLPPGRKRFDTLRSLTQLPEFAYKQRQQVSNDRYEKFLSAVRLSRFLRHPAIEARSKRLIADIGYYASTTHEFDQTVLGSLITDLGTDASRGEDEPVLGAILYLYWSSRISKVLSSSKFHGNDKDLRAGLDYAALEKLLAEMHPHGHFSLLIPLRVALLDLLDRRSEAFQVASSLTSAQQTMVQTAGTDVGVFTYKNKLPIQDDTALEWKWVHKNQHQPSDTRPVILCSVDETFLGLYGPRWLYYAQFFPDVRWHIHIVGSGIKKSEELFHELVQLAQKYTKLSGHSMPVIDASHSDVPEWVGNKVTYYACVRYLIVLDLMRYYRSPVWIQDIDLHPLGDFMKDYTSFLSYDVLTVRSPLLGGLFPWKRYLAGNVFINNSASARNWANSVIEYMRYFLPQQNTWMLDQNALSYAFEIHSINTGPFAPLRMPMTQGVGLARRIENKIQ